MYYLGAAPGGSGETSSGYDALEETFRSSEFNENDAVQTISGVLGISIGRAQAIFRRLLQDGSIIGG